MRAFDRLKTSLRALGASLRRPGAVAPFEEDESVGQNRPINEAKPVAVDDVDLSSSSHDWSNLASAVESDVVASAEVKPYDEVEPQIDTPLDVNAVLNEADQFLLNNPRAHAAIAVRALATEIRSAQDRIASSTSTAAFLGPVGAGKSTAIAVLANLVFSDEDVIERRLEKRRSDIARLEKRYAALEARIEEPRSHEVAGEQAQPATRDRAKGPDVAKELARIRNDLEAARASLPAIAQESVDKAAADRFFLPIGRGRTTLCPTHVRHAAHAQVAMKPMSDEQAHALFLDVAQSGHGETDEKISHEYASAVAQVTGFASVKALQEASAKMTDPVAFAADLFARYKPETRSATHFLCDRDDPVEEAIAVARTVKRLNAGREPRARLPMEITIHWPHAPSDIHFVDTKGLEGVAPLHLREMLLDKSVVTVFCSPYEQAPDALSLECYRSVSEAGGARRSLFAAFDQKRSDVIASNIEIDIDEIVLSSKEEQIADALAAQGLPIVPIFAGSSAHQIDELGALLRTRIAQMREHDQLQIVSDAAALADLLGGYHDGAIKALQAIDDTLTNIVVQDSFPPSPSGLPYAPLLPVHHCTVAAMLRRYGDYEKHHLGDMIAAPYEHWATSHARNLMDRFMRGAVESLARKDASAEDPEPAEDDLFRDRVAEIVATALERRFRQFIETIWLESFTQARAAVLALLRSDEAGAGMERLHGAWGARSKEIRGSERYRPFVTRELNVLLADELVCRTRLEDVVLALFRQAIGDLLPRAILPPLYPSAAPVARPHESEPESDETETMVSADDAELGRSALSELDALRNAGVEQDFPGDRPIPQIAAPVA